ncbi:MAG: DUF1311 domain-containing protein [Proteobacteria bacterium]|nr:DUF1311 domain-containing protein [Pseudomonadota bacterium]
MLKKLIFLVLFVIVISSSPAAFAGDEEKYSKEYDECMEKAGGGDLFMRECIVHEYTIWKEKVNSNYKKIINSDAFEDYEIASLKKMQNLWIQYQNEKCNFYCLNQNYCGTLNRLLEMECMLNMTKERNEELDYLIFMRIK